MRYYRKSQTVEAIQWDGNSHTANKFLGDSYGTDWEYASSTSLDIVIPRAEARKTCAEGDWIVKHEGRILLYCDESFRSLFHEAGAP